MKKQIPPNYLKVQKEMRAKRIKDTYSNLLTVKFDANFQVEYEMEMDFKSMQTAIMLIREYLGDVLDDDDKQVKTMTGNQLLLLTAILTLKRRINVPDNDDDKRFETRNL